MYKFIIILFLGLGTANISYTQTNNDILLKEENKEVALKYFLIDAKKHLSIGNIKKAIESYKKCLELETEDATIHYELADIAMAFDDTKSALTHSRIAVQKQPKNKWFLLQLISVVKKRGLWGQVDEIYDKLIAIEPLKKHFLAKLSSYKRLEEWENALKTYSEIQERFGNSFETMIGKQAIYSKLNKQKEAIRELKQLIKENPQNGDLYAVLALRYEEGKRTEEARKIYKQLSKKENKGSIGIIILANHYIEQEEFSKAFPLLKQALYENISEPKMVISSVVKLSKTKNYKEKNIHIETLSSLLTHTYPENIIGYIMYAKQLKKKKQYTEAESLLKDALEIDSLNYDAMTGLIQVYEKQNNAKALLKTAKKGIINFPEKSKFYIYKGVAEIELKEYQKAINDLKIGILYASTLVEKNIVKGILAECYFKKGDKEKAYEIYEDQLQKAPNDIDILNNYSYILCVNEDKLDKAEDMIKKCLKDYPNDIYFLDTYSWVLFKKREYKKSLETIEKIFKNNSSININAENHEHYGDILWKNNKKDKAISQWKIALTKSPDRKKEHIIKKIENGLK